MVKHKHLSGGSIVLIGIATTVGSTEYQIGTMARMGPGFYPMMLGIVMMVLGLLIAILPDSPDEILADRQTEPLSSKIRKHARPWAAIIGGMLLFIILGTYGGLVPATFSLVFISALGDHNNSVKQSFWLAVGVTAFTVAVFHYGMQMQFPLFTWL